jgi:hypothetical protein
MSRRTYPNPRPSTLPTSDVSVTMRLPRAGTHPARRPAPVLRIASVSRAIVRLGRGRLGRHPPSRTALRPPAPVKERRVVSQSRRLYRVDLAARARENTRAVCTALSVWFPDLLFAGILSGRRIRRVPARRVPMLASVRRHSSGELGELGCLPFQGAQRVALGPPGTRGARPGGDPGPSDRCLLLTDSGFKDDRPKSRRTPHRNSHAIREPPVHAAGPTSANRPIGLGAFSSPSAALPAYL